MARIALAEEATRQPQTFTTTMFDTITLGLGHPQNTSPHVSQPLLLQLLCIFFGQLLGIVKIIDSGQVVGHF